MMRRLQKCVVGLLGFALLAVGIAMIILPGPAIVVVPTGLAILATEFVWARNLQTRVHATFRRLKRSN